MSTILSGCADNITTPLGATVAGTASGAGGVIVIQTTSAHLYATCDVVTIASVGGTTEANGTWEITVIDSTHFSLNGSTWVHAWTSGGTCTDNSLTPAMQVPSDGDAATAESILAAQQALADRTQYLQKQTYPIVSRVNAGIIPTLFNRSIALHNTSQNVLNASGLVDVTGTLLVIPTTRPGDTLYCDSCGWFGNGANTQARFHLTVIDGASTTDIMVTNGASSGIAISSTGGFMLTGMYTVVTGGTLNLKLRAEDTFGGGNNFVIFGDVVTRYLILR